MRVRDWQDVVEDVVDSGVDPEGWRATGGDRSDGVGEDLYLGHPNVGVFQLKTYPKNPFEVRGVGSRVARSIDDEIGPWLPESGEANGRFGVQSPPEDETEAENVATRLEEVIKAHSDAPTTPDDLFSDVMDAMESPAYGPMEYDQYGRPEAVDELADTFEEAESVLDAELDDLIDDDAVGRGFQ